MSNIDELARIAAQPHTTKEDKEFLRDLCDELGVALPKNKRCGSCWIDKAHELYGILKKAETPSERKWVLRDGVDVIFRGVRVNRVTLTSDEIAENLLAAGFPKNLFK